MSHKTHGNAVATYIITALILGVITYVEYAIVEYEIAWLSRGAILFWLFALSIIKFIMVVAIFMHLKDDERTYTGFFGSGMVIALATFMILPLLFTVRTIPQETQAAAAAEAAHERDEAGHDDSGLSEETRAAIESDGQSRSQPEVLDTPRPADQSLAVEPPAAAESDATLRTGDEPGDAGAPAAGTPAEDGPAEDAGAAGEPLAAAQSGDFDRELGQSTYAANCQGCHQAQGGGLPGVFPPLAGNLPNLYNADGGREYLIDVVLYGLSGEIQVNGQTYNGVMPPWAQLPNEQLAAVINHAVTSWGNDAELEEFSPIEAGEVEARRGATPGDLNARRSELIAQ